MCKPKQRAALIEASDNDLIRTICECVMNVFNCNVKIPSHQLKRFRRYKNTLRQLCAKSVGINRKRQLLKQQGGFLPFLLPPLLSLIGGLAGRAIGKAVGL